MSRVDRIQTCELSVPNRTRYQTAPQPGGLAGRIRTDIFRDPNAALNQAELRPDDVGTAGLEPTTTDPPDRCATKLRHVPQQLSAPSRIRTCDPPIRNRVRYPLRHQGMRPAGRSRTCCLRVISTAPIPRGPRRVGEGAGFEPATGSPFRASNAAPSATRPSLYDASRTGFEPAASGLTARRSDLLS